MSLPWRQLEHAPAHVVRTQVDAHPALTRWTAQFRVRTDGPHSDELDLPGALLDRDGLGGTVFRATGVSVDLRHPDAAASVRSVAEASPLAAVLGHPANRAHLVLTADLAPVWRRYGQLHTWLAHRAIVELVSEGDVLATPTAEPAFAWAALGFVDTGLGVALGDDLRDPAQVA